MKKPRYFYEKYWVKVTQYELRELTISVNAWMEHLTYNFENFRDSKLFQQLYMNLIVLQNLSELLQHKQRQSRPFYALQLNANQAFTLMNLLLGDNLDGLSHILRQLDRQYKNRMQPEEVKVLKKEPVKYRKPYTKTAKVRGNTKHIGSFLSAYQKPKKKEYKNIFQLAQEDAQKTKSK